MPFGSTADATLRERGGLEIALRAISRIEPAERSNVATHVLGSVLSAIGGHVLTARAWQRGDPVEAAAFILYGITLVCAFFASVLYHGSRNDVRHTYLKVDRMAIYLAIAGSNTPLAVSGLPNDLGIPVLISSWVLALVGCALERHSRGQPRHRTILLCAVMGWACLWVARPLVTQISWSGFVWLVLGCSLYSLGVVIASLRAIPHHHEIWHVLALAGSACHFIVLHNYLP